MHGYTANLSSATVQTAINAAAKGAVICLPAGSATWTTPVTISKAITLRGAGAGGYVGRSDTSLAVGTGSKTFTTKAGLSFVPTEPITARYTNRAGANSMTGTVTSYSGTTLVLNITSVTGSGTFAAWVFERPSITTIINSYVRDYNQALLSLTEDTASIAVEGIHFDTGTGVLGDHIHVNGTTNGTPVLIHDNWFTQTGGLGAGVNFSVNRGIVYRNSFNNNLCSASFVPGCSTTISGAIGNKSEGDLASWTTPSTMGMADTGGTHNVYLEDNYFLGFWQAMTGMDGHSRMVVRYNVFDSSALGSHGADTEDLGVRHFEVYNNTFVQSDRGGDPYNLNYWFYIRGGTGVITDNVFDDLNTPGYWGDKAEILATIQNLQRGSAPNPCWGANIPGIQYPAPRQVGMGYVTGAAGNDSITYKGDSEPLYIWNNTGTYVFSLQDYGGTNCTNPDSVVDYVKSGRDYFWNAGAKPGYTKYTYPHPLRQEGVGTTPSPPMNLRIGG